MLSSLSTTENGALRLVNRPQYSAIHDDQKQQWEDVHAENVDDAFENEFVVEILFQCSGVQYVNVQGEVVIQRVWDCQRTDSMFSVPHEIHTDCESHHD